MGRIETAFIRHCLKPAVTCDLPGRLRLSYKSYQMLPKEALPYLHYAQDVMAMLPGVQETQVNPRIGTVLVTYDPKQTNREEILRWIATATDLGLELAQEIDWAHSDVSEQELAQMARRRLQLRLAARETR